MCRLLLACAGDGADDIPLDSLVKAKSTTRSKLFGLQRGERLHGFGVAWLPVRGPAGCVVTLRPPLDDLNVRRVAAAAGGRVALAHVRSCACDSCPATTYCPAPSRTASPSLRIGLRDVGILAHHRALAKSGGEAARRADAAGALDCGNSDSAFLFRVFVSLYDETRDVAAALRRLAALVAADAPPSSLNLVAADGAGAVALRFRSLATARPPPLCHATIAVRARAAAPEAVEALLRCGAAGDVFDVAVSGWGARRRSRTSKTRGPSRRTLLAAALPPPRLLQVVSSANNFMGPQQTYADLRARAAAAGSDAEALDARIRLATRPGDFYYPVAGHDYFFSAVTPARERQRLLAAGFAEATISACNVRLLALGAARATGEKARRTARLFDPDRTLVDQAARYLISVARR
ncbi:hypothetical protein JL720_10680 [Aureococcus anophagefferens]|nr:hypothetical protein JL720_10680 [Aureococcus anophagefferens]